MDSSSYTMEDLKKKYSGFISPSFEINVNGTKLIADSNLSIEELTVDQSAHLDENGTAGFKISGFLDAEEQVLDSKLLTDTTLPMQPVTISVGYGDKQADVFQGVIYERTVTWGAEELPTCEVTCVDAKAFMRQNRRYESHSEIDSKSALITTLLDSYDSLIDKKTVNDTPSFDNPRTIHQHGISDFDFIKKTAREEGFEFFIVKGELYFGEPMSVDGSIIKLSWKTDIIEASQTFSLAHKYTAVNIYGYNQDSGESSTGEATSISTKVGGGKTALKYLGDAGLELPYCQTMPMNTQSQTDVTELGKTVLMGNSMDFVQLKLETVGLPEIIPGRLLTLKDMGDGLDDDYYIVKVTHRINLNGYTTTIECTSNTL